MKIVDYKDLNLQPLDIILCSGESRMSRSIVKFQRMCGANGHAAEISHVASIYNDYVGQTPRVFESTTLNWNGKKGVQMNRLSEWLPNYNGRVFVKQLLRSVRPSFLNADRRFWLEHYTDSYESGIPGTVELLLCGLRLSKYVRKVFPNYKPSATDKLHCTELIAMRMKHHEVWNYEVNVNRMPPHIWWSAIDIYLKIPTEKIVRIK